MSERRQYTPGPWFFGRTGRDKRMILGGPNGKYVTTVTIHQIPHLMGLLDEPEREANAQLIAAAPELLEALEAAHEELGFHYYEPELEKQITNALAKARGETER